MWENKENQMYLLYSSLIVLQALTKIQYERFMVLSTVDVLKQDICIGVLF